MFGNVLRVMNVDGIRWLETVHDTIYRCDERGWIIHRARGKNNRGRITGVRFMAYVKNPDGVIRKMCSPSGAVRYFDDPIACAQQVVKFHNNMASKWATAKLVTEAEELTLKVKALREELAALETVYHRTASVGGSGNGAPVSLHEEQVMNTSALSDGMRTLPAHLRAMAARVWPGVATIQ